MTTRPSVVETALELHLVAPGASAVPIVADLRYDIGDPYAVQVCFHTRSSPGADTVQWTFARALLSDGLIAPSGEGDVHVWPARSNTALVVCLSLRSPSGQALFELPEVELAAFLARTYDAVPSGTEGGQVDLDAELAYLLCADPGA